MGVVRSLCEMETTASDCSERPDETHVVEMLEVCMATSILGASLSS